MFQSLFIKLFNIEFLLDYLMFRIYNAHYVPYLR